MLKVYLTAQGLYFAYIQAAFSLHGGVVNLHKNII